MGPWGEDSASQPAGWGELPSDTLFVQSPQVNRTSLGKVWQGLKSRRKVTVPVTCVCLSFTERKAEEATAAGPGRGLQGHR